MADEQKPKEWTGDDVNLAAAKMTSKFAAAIRDSELLSLKGGSTTVVRSLFGLAAFFARQGGVSRHDFVDAAKLFYDEVEAKLSEKDDKPKPS